MKILLAVLPFLIVLIALNLLGWLNIRKTILLRVLSFLLIVAITFGFFAELKKRNIINSNKKVSVQIIEMPECCDCSNNDALFKYNNQQFRDAVAFDFCKKYKKGDSMPFYHMNNYPDIFVSELYADHSSTLQIVMSLLLIVFFSYCFYYSFKA